MNNIITLIISTFSLLYPGSTTQISSVISSTKPSLISHIEAQVDDRIKQTNKENGVYIYSDRSMDIKKPWILNENSWVFKGTPLDLSGVSAWTNDEGYVVNGVQTRKPNQGAITLITPKHYLTANHYKLFDNAEVSFFDKSGKQVLRRVVKNYTIPGTDINIGILDRDVDGGVANYSLISYESLQKLRKCDSNQYSGSDIPILVINQQRQALVRSIVIFNDKYINHSMYSDGPRIDFTRQLYGGDSGGPGFLIINNRPVLIFTNYSTIAAPNLGGYIEEIQKFITENDSSLYNIKTVDISSFIEYERGCSGYLITPTVSSMDTMTPYNVGDRTTIQGSGFDELVYSDIMLKKGDIETLIPSDSQISPSKISFIVPDIQDGDYDIYIKNRNVSTEGIVFKVLKKVEKKDNSQEITSDYRVVGTTPPISSSYNYAPSNTNLATPSPESKPVVSNKEGLIVKEGDELKVIDKPIINSPQNEPKIDLPSKSTGSTKSNSSASESARDVVVLKNDTPIINESIGINIVNKENNPVEESRSDISQTNRQSGVGSSNLDASSPNNSIKNTNSQNFEPDNTVSETEQVNNTLISETVDGKQSQVQTIIESTIEVVVYVYTRIVNGVETVFKSN